MALLARGLAAGYGRTTLLGPLDLSLPAGRLVCLIGANGAGKSTLIRTLCGMQPALAGEVCIDGTPLAALSPAERARSLSVVLTERVQVTLMTGYELASLGRYPHLGWSGRLGAHDHAAVRAALTQAGAGALADRLVSELSDGERQKLMIARALAQEPRLLVLDEATAFLDLPRRIETMQLLLDLARRQQIAVLLSTHDLELALRYADTLWLIDGQRQVHAGAPEDLALSGLLGATFAAEGLAFDLERGELVVGRGGDRPIRLEGDGIPAAWARRALQRAGFVIDAQASDAVHASAERYMLRPAAGEPRHYRTLGALVEGLASHTRASQGESA
jgi:iron complex transport system ATP-binding protein